LKKIEAEIADFEQSVKSIEAEIANEAVYSNAGKLAEANKNYINAKHQLDNAQNKWEELASDIMEMEG
jgi:ATP-binding cassette subfamily F protein 3